MLLFSTTRIVQKPVDRQDTGNNILFLVLQRTKALSPIGRSAVMRRFLENDTSAVVSVVNVAFQSSVIYEPLILTRLPHR